MLMDVLCTDGPWPLESAQTPTVKTRLDVRRWVLPAFVHGLLHAPPPQRLASASLLAAAWRTPSSGRPDPSWNTHGRVRQFLRGVDTLRGGTRFAARARLAPLPLTASINRRS